MLDPHQRTQKRPGESLSYAALSKAQQAVVNDVWDLGWNAWVKYDIPGEPTEIWPKGPQGNWTLTVGGFENRSWFIKSGRMVTNPATADWIAYRSFYAQHPDEIPKNDEVLHDGSGDRYAEGTQQYCTIKLAPRPDQLLLAVGMISHYPGGPGLKFDELPKTLRDEVADKLRSMNEDYARRAAGKPKSTKPPPPY